MLHPLIVLLLISPLAAQTEPASPIDLPHSTRLTLLTSRESIHAADDPEPPNLTPIQRAIQLRQRFANNFTSIDLEVIINESGRVESAHAVSGPQQFYAQAEQIELHRAFTPVRIDNIIARVRTHDYVSIYPPERWSATKVPFPVSPNLATVTLGLERTHCYGTCPAYSVSITGAGDITFSSSDTSLAVPGIHRAHIAPEAVRALLDQFRHADFLSAEDEYRCGWTDLATQTLTLSMDGKTKRVIDYGGSIVGLPDSIEALELAIDRGADVARWTTGNSATLAALTAEHWNFADTTPDNIKLYDSSIVRQDHDLVQLFLTSRAPVSTDDPQLLSPVCVASQTGNLDLLRQMLASFNARSKPSASLLAECLSASARSGNLDVLDLWLDKGAHPGFATPSGNRVNWQKFTPPLVNAIQSGNPAVLDRLLKSHPDLSPAANDGRSLLATALHRGDSAQWDGTRHMLESLLAAGADPNVASENEQPALFDIGYAPSAIPILLQAGANLNARGRAGYTPLMNAAFILAAVKAFLAAGADPWLKDDRGKTALDHSRQFSCKECTDVLLKAMGPLTP